MTLNPAIIVALVAALLAALAYAVYKHVGAAKLKADLADPRKILTDALAATKADLASIDASTAKAAATMTAAAATLAPAPSASPAPAASPAPPPAPAAVVASDGSDPAKVTTLIAQLQAKGVTSWRDIAMYLQTWGFSRGLTPSEWNAALAAGMPAAMLQPPTVPTDTSAPFWRPLGDGGFEAAFDRVSGAWCHVKGPGYLHIMVPSNFVGRIWPCANLCPDTAYPVKTTVNHGDLKEAITDGEQAHGVLVFGDTPGANEIAGTAGQWIEMEFDQAATSGYVGVFYIYPKAPA